MTISIVLCGFLLFVVPFVSEPDVYAALDNS
jgi:hypothetical protein